MDSFHSKIIDTKGWRSFLPFSAVQFSRSVMSNSLWPHGLQHARPPCPSPTPRAYSNSHPSSWWCHPTISSSVFPFFSCLQSFLASGSFPMSVCRIRWPKYWSFCLWETTDNSGKLAGGREMWGRTYPRASVYFVVGVEPLVNPTAGAVCSARRAGLSGHVLNQPGSCRRGEGVGWI